MPIPVIGSVSEPEAMGLGKLFEAHARKHTGTLVNGNDIAPETDDSCCGQLRGYFITRTGQPIITMAEHCNRAQSIQLGCL